MEMIIYGDDKEKLSAAMVDNLGFINTHPNLVGFLMGLMISLEEGGANRETVNGLKLALFGPIAGIGDAIFWFTILPIVAGISCSFATQGSVLGPIVFFLTYLIIWILRIVWTKLGYRLGTKSIDMITSNSDILANAATILGITVIGALIASYVSITLLPVITVDGGIEVAVQEQFFDNIFPNILPMAVTLLCFWLLKKKQISPVVLIVGIIVISIGCSWIGLM
ncbi:PTS system mannose/fructose/sorbose family transporter subunit IID [Faecalicoccus pleomorphus]|uniref:PTS system mannose/fructose/sorbose family transporter subunit IID n=1 Tax=Faecalicoccus pleomorphus TaxID=1323 RepID=UPI002FE55985